MKTLCVPASNPNYEYYIQDVTSSERYYRFLVTYRKCWPCEDGIFEAPNYATRIPSIPHLKKYFGDPVHEDRWRQICIAFNLPLDI